MKFLFFLLSVIFIFTVLIKDIQTQIVNTDTEIDQENTLFNSTFIFTCQNSTNCFHHGKCLNTTHCLCRDYYTTIFNSDNIQCNYLKLSQKKAFLLSFFLGSSGIDHFYLGNFILGLTKLLTPLSLIFVSLLLFYSGKERGSRKMMIIGKIIELGASMLIIAWWFVDWILVLRGFYLDNNSVNLFNDI
jgi:hypothetical protein